MSLEKLGASRFRNLEDISISPENGVNFIVGDNGSGKTSLLEAMFYLGRGLRSTEQGEVEMRGFHSKNSQKLRSENLRRFFFPTQAHIEHLQNNIE